jgi:hypothetical protein
MAGLYIELALFPRIIERELQKIVQGADRSPY